MSDCGHGWVHPRPDGVKARCGGPVLCSKCALDQAQLQLQKTVMLLTCTACGQSYRAAHTHELPSRRCLCGGELTAQLPSTEGDSHA